MKKRPNLGFTPKQRIICTRDTPHVPLNTKGTTTAVNTASHGLSIYPDPSKLMVLAHWDNGVRVAVFRFQARPLSDLEQQSDSLLADIAARELGDKPCSTITNSCG